MIRSSLSNKKYIILLVLSFIGFTNLVFTNCSNFKATVQDFDQTVLAESSSNINLPSDETLTSSVSAPKVFLFSKAKFDDGVRQQERALEATTYISSKILQWVPAAQITRLDEKVFPPLDSNNPIRPSEVLVTKAKIISEFQRFAQTVTSEDTVIIYSHSHGKDNIDATGEQGGLILQEPMLDVNGNPIVAQKRNPNGMVSLEQRFTSSILTWSEYSDLILSLPAKNVIVFTMACFSGNLVETLNKESYKMLWANRKNSGRSFAVVSAQNSDLLSGPIQGIGGSNYTMNGLPFAVGNAFKKDFINQSADGYSRVAGANSPAFQGVIDNKLSISELVYYAHDYSRTLGSSADYNNESMLTGSWVDQ